MLATICMCQGNYDQAMVHFQKAIDVYEQGARHECLNQVASYTGMAHCHQLKENYEQVIKFGQKAIAVTERLELPMELAGKCCLIMTGALYVQKQYDEAVAFCRKGIAILEQEQPGSMKLAMTYRMLASFYLKQRDVERYIHYHRKAIAIQELCNPDSTELADSYFDLAVTIKQHGGNLDRACVYCAKSVKIEIHQSPNGSLKQAERVQFLAEIFYQKGDYNQSIHFAHCAVELNERLAPESLGLAASYFTLATALRARGDEFESNLYFVRAVVIFAQGHTFDVLSLIQETSDLAPAA